MFELRTDKKEDLMHVEGVRWTGTTNRQPDATRRKRLAGDWRTVGGRWRFVGHPSSRCMSSILGPRQCSPSVSMMHEDNVVPPLPAKERAATKTSHSEPIAVFYNMRQKIEAKVVSREKGFAMHDSRGKGSRKAPCQSTTLSLCET